MPMNPNHGVKGESDQYRAQHPGAVGTGPTGPTPHGHPRHPLERPIQLPGEPPPPGEHVSGHEDQPSRMIEQPQLPRGVVPHGEHPGEVHDRPVLDREFFSR